MNLEKMEYMLREITADLAEFNSQPMHCDEDPPLCAVCNGSGEGQYDGTRCWHCKGTGTDKGDQS